MFTLSGRRYAPGSARPEPAHLHLRDDGVLDLFWSGGREARWLRDVTVSSPLAGIPRDFRFTDGSKFDCEDDPRIGAWLESQGKQLGSNLLGKLERRWRWVVPSVVLVGLATAAAVIWGIPASAGLIAPLVPDRARAELGVQSRKILTSMLGDQIHHKYIEVDLEPGFRRFAEPYVTKDYPITLLFYEGGIVGPNALAIPDGTVIMTEEFVEFAEADSVALLGVLAHEIGHLHHRHSLQRAIQAASLPALVSFITGDLGTGSAMMGTVPMQLIENGYSRDHEREADEFARDLMRANNISTQPVADLFQRMRDEMGDTDSSWMSTHPLHEERMEFFRDPGPEGGT